MIKTIMQNAQSSICSNILTIGDLTNADQSSSMSKQQQHQQPTTLSASSRLYSVESIQKLTSSPIGSTATKSSSTTNLSLCTAAAAAAAANLNTSGAPLSNKLTNATIASMALELANSGRAAGFSNSTTISSSSSNPPSLVDMFCHATNGGSGPLCSGGSHTSVITPAQHKAHLAKVPPHIKPSGSGSESAVNCDDESDAKSSMSSSSVQKPKSMVATPQQVMALYMNKLTPYEHHEIYKYAEIYFIGANAKKRPGIVGPNNSDYDNEQGSYIQVSLDSII